MSCARQLRRRSSESKNLLGRREPSQPRFGRRRSGYSARRTQPRGHSNIDERPSKCTIRHTRVAGNTTTDLRSIKSPCMLYKHRVGDTLLTDVSVQQSVRVLVLSVQKLQQSWEQHKARTGCDPAKCTLCCRWRIVALPSFIACVHGRCCSTPEPKIRCLGAPLFDHRVRVLGLMQALPL